MINEPAIRVLLERLRNPNSRQATGHLRDYDPNAVKNGEPEGRCCLGHACDVYHELTGEGQWEAVTSGGDHWHFHAGKQRALGSLPEEVRQFFGFRTSAGDCTMEPVDEEMTQDIDGVAHTALIELNDQYNQSLAQIADIIESRPTGLFEEE